jgi:CTP synthase
MLHANGLDDVVCRSLGLTNPMQEQEMMQWQQMVDEIKNLKKTTKIAIVGKYVALHDAYLSVREALYHGGYANDAHVEVQWVDSEEITAETVAQQLEGISGILVPGGFGDRGIEGKILACQYAREHNVPYLGICLGMQIAVIEFARNVLGIADANSREFTPEGEHCVIDLMEEQMKVVRKGGTMRLGAYPCKITAGSRMEEAYGQELIQERHRHRFEFNNDYRDALSQAGLTISGTSPDGLIVEAVEDDKNTFHVGVQFHPEFKSRPNKPHPLFVEFIKAGL